MTMNINTTELNCTLEDVIRDLQTDLRVHDIHLLDKIKNTGNNIMVCCPYHLERHPSAGINKDTGVFHCFACGEVHSLPEVISHCYGKEDGGKYGWKWLLQRYASVESSNRKVQINIGNRNAKQIRNDVTYVSEAELDKYRFYHPYMYKRGLTDAIIEKFDIGYDPDTECITFPIRDVAGHCLFVARRSVNRKWFNYPEGVDKPLYGLYELQSVDPFPSEVIVCESMLDALSFWVIGKYAVALNGLGTELQFQQLRELPCRKLIIATDMDERGLNARKKIRKELYGYKIITEYLFPEGRKDANECTQEELRNIQEIM